MPSRRSFLCGTAAGLISLAGCRTKPSGYSGFAFVANEEGGAVAAVDLESFTVARHIRLDGNPTRVSANPAASRVYALTPANGCVHEIATDTLSFVARLQVARTATSMLLSPDGKSIVILCREPRQLVVVSSRGLKIASVTPLSAEPNDLDLSPDGKYAGVSYGAEQAIGIIRLEDRNTAGLIPCRGEVGAVRFRGDSKSLIAADLSRHMLSIYEVASREAVVDLPLAVRPDRLCFNSDGGQLFVSGEGGDGVVIVFPYYTPEVAETVLAGRNPGAMAASANPAYLFVANPKSSDVSILDIDSRKLIAVTPVGTNPNYITVTPDGAYALVLNETSGDMAVIRTESIARSTAERWRNRRGALFMMIPVGSKPVSAVVTSI